MYYGCLENITVLTATVAIHMSCMHPDVTCSWLNYKEKTNNHTVTGSLLVTSSALTYEYQETTVEMS